MSRPNQVLIQNTGAIDGTTWANPASVPAGRLACFDDLGVGKALNAAAPSKYKLVLGTADGPITTSLLTGTKLTPSKTVFAAAVKSSVVITGFPVGPAGGATYGLILTNLGTNREQFQRKSTELEVAASETVDAIIGRFVDGINSLNTFCEAKSNRDFSLTLTGTSGSGLITIGGNSYAVTFNSTLAQTAADFVTNHAATILNAHSLVVTNPSGAEIKFVADTTKGNPTATFTQTASDLGATPTVNTAASILTITAILQSTILSVGFQEYLATASMTATVVAGAPGTGTSDQMAELERKARGSTGRYYQENFVLGGLADPATFTVDGTQYDVYNVLHENSMDLSINRSFEYQEIIIGLAAAVTGDLDTFFGL